MGEEKGVENVVEQFILNCATDDRVKAHFIPIVNNEKRLQEFRLQLNDQICEAAEGPCSYDGRSMKEAHKGMGITEDQFNAVIEALRSALDTQRVSSVDRQKILSAFQGVRGEIVER